MRKADTVASFTRQLTEYCEKHELDPEETRIYFGPMMDGGDPVRIEHEFWPKSGPFPASTVVHVREADE